MIFELFIINILFIYGIQFAFKDGNILNFVDRRYVSALNKCLVCLYWRKALFVCAPCMSSVWGWCFWLTGYEWFLYPIWVACLTGANVLIGKFTRQ